MSRPPQYHQNGQRLGPYQLGHTQYHGGHGPLYDATANGVACAVKLVYELGDQKELARLCAVEHPRLARILDVSKQGDYPLVATEWLDGYFLGDELGFNPLTPQRALSLIDVICEALAALHAAGQVHGNLKTWNVFVGRPEGPSEAAGPDVKILDPALPAWDKTDDLAQVRALLQRMLEDDNPPWRAPLERAETVSRLRNLCEATLGSLSKEELVRPFVRKPPPPPPPMAVPFPTNWSPPPSRPGFGYTLR